MQRYKIGSLVILIVVVIGLFLFFNITRVKAVDYLEYNYVQVDTQIPGTKAKPAVYEELKPIELFVGDAEIDENNDGKPDVEEVFIGEDIKEGNYEVTSLELDTYCSLKVKDKYDDNMFGGVQIYEGDEIILTEYDKLGAFNCLSHNGGLNVTLTPLDGAKIIEQEVEAVEASTLRETIFSTDEGDFCYIDNILGDGKDAEKVECEQIKDLEMKKEKGKKDGTIKNVTAYTGFKKECFTDKKVVQCDQEVTFDSVIEKDETEDTTY